ncbi:tRNA pseudouridine(38-40) synthase TruA [Rickettsiales bacterium]|nr:tRNA pseudouridine(38-40) synthase TruA [Rickettsiales bacterium]
MRIKLLIEYDGTNYVGWQKQKKGISVQKEIETCLKKLFNKEIVLFVAGRTDSGVHAMGQVAHFDIHSQINPSKISSAINFYLNESDNNISILESKEVDKSFDSRFSAKKRTYFYRILNRKSPSPLLINRAWFVPYYLDTNDMLEASKYLIGKHDFNSFRSSQCQGKNSIRSIDEITILRKGDEIHFSISAKSFLHNQVRIIVGSLVNVGRKFWKKDKIKEVLMQKIRTKAGPTAPSHGLYLEKISY